MRSTDWAQLRTGHRVQVKYGRHGSQIAQVLEPMDADGFIRVRKWSWEGKHWTNPQRIHCVEILRLASAGEISTLAAAEGRAQL